MSKIILVRHAQASLGKANYDELSELGLSQAALLGKYFDKISLQPEMVIAGSLKRHQQTAHEIMKALPDDIPLQQNPDWDEFDFKKLIQLYLMAHPSETPAPGDIRAFFSILKKSMLAWSENKLDLTTLKLESWDDFSARVSRATNSLLNTQSDKPVLVVSSGGAIAMQLMKVLEVTPKVMIDMNFQIRNTSFTEIIKKPHKLNLVAFNQVNHLMEAQDKSIITFA